MRHDTSVLLFVLVSAWAGCDNRDYFNFPKSAANQTYAEAELVQGNEADWISQHPREFIAEPRHDIAPPGGVLIGRTKDMEARPAARNDIAPAGGVLDQSRKRSPQADSAVSERALRLAVLLGLARGSLSR